jgi:UDP-N-acetylglucosamine--N-acetylmuramyl-(pentapeptide) pyrophosphoryl-undecaprenol N-acetylglucosamine transferase
VGFGGYPTVRPEAAAALLRVPAVIHEQNGVMGGPTGFLARWGHAHRDRVSGGAGHPGECARAPAPHRQPDPSGRARSGQDADAVRRKRAPRSNLLVFGGSQGARVMSDIVPPAIERLAPEHRSCLAVVQQAREEDMPASGTITPASASRPSFSPSSRTCPAAWPRPIS